MSSLKVKEVMSQKAISAPSHKVPTSFHPDLPPPLPSTVARGLAEDPSDDLGLRPDLGLEQSTSQSDRTPPVSLSPPPSEDAPQEGVFPDPPFPHQTLTVARPLTIKEPTDGDMKITLTRTRGQWCMTVLEGWDDLTKRDMNLIRNRILKVGFGQMDRLRRTVSALGKENVTLIDKAE